MHGRILLYLHPLRVRVILPFFRASVPKPHIWLGMTSTSKLGKVNVKSHGRHTLVALHFQATKQLEGAASEQSNTATSQSTMVVVSA